MLMCPGARHVTQRPYISVDGCINVFAFQRVIGGICLQYKALSEVGGTRKMHYKCIPFTQHHALSDFLTRFALLQEEEEQEKRQVLVLGLDGAGKSSMLQGLNPGESAAKRGRCRPTRGFNFMSLDANSCQLGFLESKTFILICLDFCFKSIK